MGEGRRRSPGLRSAGRGRGPVALAFGSLFEAERIRALAFIPLLSRGRLIGKFMVYFDREHALDPEDFELARAIANTSPRRGTDARRRQADAIP
jgi:GAF domain-containing protein